MSLISVSHLKKQFKIPQKEPGFKGALTSFVHRTYTTATAVNDISFSIEKGELIGFIGPNGAGKTTTLKMLSGLLYPTSGEITVLGHTPFERRPEFLRQISLVMGQKNQLWWDLPAMDTFLLNKEIYDIPTNQFKATVDELVALLEVGEVLKTPVRKLSLGQRMKMELIAALIHQPKILFLDEPTIGLDVVMQVALRDFIRDYNRKFEATVILTSHYMDDVKQLCKRVVVIDHGNVMYDGSLESLVLEFSPYKNITLQLEKEVSQEKVHKLGDVVSYDFPTLVYRVEREKATTFASKLLKSLPIADLNIEEPKIEDIIRDVFKENAVKNLRS